MSNQKPKTVMEVLSRLWNEAYSAGMSWQEATGKKWVEPINRAISDLERIIVPEKENESKLCKCFTPDIKINEEENLIWCSICNKQHGSKTWNAAIEDMKARINGNLSAHP